MSVSSDLKASFQLLKPLESTALKVDVKNRETS